jgi:3-oxoacyl-[acyl-carrier protein] reductase
MEIKNKTVVVTGGTKGLGKELALAFKKEGANVVVCARSKSDFGHLSKQGILEIKADVTKERHMNRLMKVAEKRFGQVDLWVNNAGIWLPHAPVEKVDWSRAHSLIEVNLFGTVYGSKVALVEMRKQGFGLIVNIISTSALSGRVNSSAYCASKYAADGFTKSLREEVKGTSIKVISVYPGGMQTSFFDEKKPEEYGQYMSPDFIAGKILENLKKDNPEEELVLKRSA